MLQNPKLKAVQFFGTSEILILPGTAQVHSWDEGVQQQFREKSKRKGLNEAYWLAQSYIETGLAPFPLWWCAPDPVEELSEDEGSEMAPGEAAGKEIKSMKRKGGSARTVVEADRKKREQPVHPWTTFDLARLEIRHSAWFHDWHGDFMVKVQSKTEKLEAIQYAVPAADFALDHTFIRPAKPEYEKLRRSEFVSFVRPTRCHKDETISCGCKPDAAGACCRDDNCLNRVLRVLCDARECHKGCENKSFHMREPPRTRIFPTTDGRGWGVKAHEPIKAGTFITEYIGEIIDDAESERRLWVARKDGIKNFYMMELSPNMVIDAGRKGNISRFLNSSCDPNCETQKWREAATGETRVGIFSLRDIDVGEELTYDYNFQHFGDQASTSFRCFCGAAKCRGALDREKALTPTRKHDAKQRLHTAKGASRVSKKLNLSAAHLSQLGVPKPRVKPVR
eukprot:scaffold551_cov395-Prasinococcus_capsulatus_cf.AAC.10